MFIVTLRVELHFLPKGMQKKAPVYNYHYSSQGHKQILEVLPVRSCKGFYPRGGTDRIGDLILTNEVFHAIYTRRLCCHSA